MFDLIAYEERQKEWSTKTFGSGRRTLGISEHIRKELEEIKADPLDLMEWIDVIILGMDGFWRAGGAPDMLVEFLEIKQSRNFGRVYPFPTSEDVAVEHTKGE